MSEASLVVAGLRLFVLRGSATATGSDLELESELGSGIILPSSAFFPSRTAALGVTRIGPGAFKTQRITSMSIPRHLQILSSECFSDCNSLSSISFEVNSELTRIESSAFHGCSCLESITIPRHLQILCSECFSNYTSLSSISFETESELTHIKSNAFYRRSSLKSITIPRHFQILSSECFSNCKSLSSISFETDSKLTHIDAQVCWETNLSLVVLPASTSFIAGDAFSRSCTVTLAGWESEP
jgi:predicted metal-binding protein